MTVQEKLIRNKPGLLELASYLGNVSEACCVMGYSRDTFYRVQRAYDDGDQCEPRGQMEPWGLQFCHPCGKGCPRGGPGESQPLESLQEGCIGKKITGFPKTEKKAARKGPPFLFPCFSN